MDGGARLNYTKVCTLMLSKQADICTCVDVQLPPGGGSVPGLIAQLLGGGYTVHLHSAGPNRAVGGVLFIAGPRVTHKRMMPVCKHGSTAVLHCRFGSRPVRVVGTYWPVKNLTGAGSLWNRMRDESAEDNIDPIIQVKSHITSLCAEAQGEVIIVTGDFNTDVGKGDVYNLTGTIQMSRLRHSSTPAELLVPSYHRATLAGTRLDYQLVGGPADSGGQLMRNNR